MNFNYEYLNNLSTDTLKQADPKEFILFLAHSLRLGALYKAKFFMWIENSNYEIIAQDDEETEHLLKETLSIFKKASSETVENNIDFMDNIFYSVLKKSGKFEEQDCISLSLCLLAFVSFKQELITNEEYLEIRDLLVPYKLMISQCKLKAEELMKLYKEENIDQNEDIMLLAKLGKGIVTKMPKDEIVNEAFKEITYDEKSWEKE